MPLMHVQAVIFTMRYVYVHTNNPVSDQFHSIWRHF